MGQGKHSSPVSWLVIEEDNLSQMPILISPGSCSMWNERAVQALLSETEAVSTSS